MSQVTLVVKAFKTAYMLLPMHELEAKRFIATKRSLADNYRQFLTTLNIGLTKEDIEQEYQLLKQIQTAQKEFSLEYA